MGRAAWQSWPESRSPAGRRPRNRRWYLRSMRLRRWSLPNRRRYPGGPPPVPVIPLVSLRVHMPARRLPSRRFGGVSLAFLSLVVMANQCSTVPLEDEERRRRLIPSIIPAGRQSDLPNRKQVSKLRTDPAREPVTPSEDHYKSDPLCPRKRNRELDTYDTGERSAALGTSSSKIL